MASKRTRANPCKKPTGWLGKLVLRIMNAQHSKVTDWGLSHVSIGTHDTILDVGCGGGRTVNKLAAAATQGRVCGVDYSKESVAVTSRVNREWINKGRVEIREATVSQLPFPEGVFDLVTAVETHFWWPDLPAGMREILRVLKPEGTLVIIAEIYKQAATRTAALAEKHLPFSGMTLLTVSQHRELFANAGFSDIQVIEERSKGWICAIGRKPSVPTESN